MVVLVLAGIDSGQQQGVDEGIFGGQDGAQFGLDFGAAEHVGAGQVEPPVGAVGRQGLADAAVEAVQLVGAPLQPRRRGGRRW